MDLRTAVVGYGVIGHVHEFVARKHGKLCGVCDIKPEVLENIEPELRYTDYIRMLDEILPDVVHICTPHYLHADMVVEALDRGINVLCEKPLCIKHGDIERILEAEKRSSAILGVCLQNRYNAATLFVKNYLVNKKVDCASGTVFWHRDEAYYASGDWRGKWNTEGGGVLINQALHTLDLLIWLCGEPGAVTASTSKLKLSGSIEVEDTATLICDGESPFVFCASNCSARDCPVELTVMVDGKPIKILPHSVMLNDELHKFEEAHTFFGKECYGSSHELLISDFYDCVLNKRHFTIDGTEGAKVIRVILGAYASHGKKINVT